MSGAIATTKIAGLAPRVVDGAAIEEAWPRIQAALAGRLGDAHAALFAEPRRDRDEIAWVARAAGPVQGLDRMDVARRAAALSKAERLLADVRALADRITPESSGARRLARILRVMAAPPAPQHVRLVGDQPVILLWTHEAPAAAAPAAAGPTVMPSLDGAAAVRGAAALPAAPVAPPPASARPSPLRHMAWLIPLLILPALVWLILQQPIRAEPDPALAAKVAALRQQLATLAAADTAACTVSPKEPEGGAQR